jgi:uncharacterized damage-inducible protein DinB
MLTARQLLLKQTAEAFRGRADMPLMASLEGIMQEEASWQPDEATPTIEQIVRHVAWSKCHYCREGLGRPMVLIDESVNADGDSPSVPWEFPCGAAWGISLCPGITEAVKLLEQAHRVITECLEGCSDEALAQPIPTRHGASSAAHFFWVMIMHDLYHAGQIRTRRSLYKTRSARA